MSRHYERGWYTVFGVRQNEKECVFTIPKSLRTYDTIPVSLNCFIFDKKHESPVFNSERPKGIQVHSTFGNNYVNGFPYGYIYEKCLQWVWALGCEKDCERVEH